MNGLQTLPQWRTFFDEPEGAILGLMNSVPAGQGGRHGGRHVCL